MKRFGFSLLLIALLALPAHAAHKQPAADANALAQLQSQLAARKENQARLQAEVKEATKSLGATKVTMVRTAQSVRDSEQKLQGLEGKIATLSQQESALGRRLQDDYASMGDTILALVRLRRTPPELLMLRPGAPLQTAQTATVLGSILPSLNKQVAALDDGLKKVTALHLSLEQSRAQAMAAKAALSKKYSEVAALAHERTALYKKLNSDYAATAREVERMSQQAHNMQELVDQLARQQNTGGKKAYSWAVPKPGQPQLPVPGAILTGYGQTDSIGAISQGLTITSNARALVVAPMGGVVRFSGIFKNYGRLVILEHEGGYISLISGLDTVDTAIGQGLDAGEPIGKLSEASSRGGNPTLYYELRYQGRPVNPSEKFPGLKAKG